MAQGWPIFSAKLTTFEIALSSHLPQVREIFSKLQAENNTKMRLKLFQETMIVEGLEPWGLSFEQLKSWLLERAKTPAVRELIKAIEAVDGLAFLSNTAIGDDWTPRLDEVRESSVVLFSPLEHES